MEAAARRLATWVVLAAIALLVLKFAVGAFMSVLVTVAVIAVIGFALMLLLRRI